MTSDRWACGVCQKPLADGAALAAELAEVPWTECPHKNRADRNHVVMPYVVARPSPLCWVGLHKWGPGNPHGVYDNHRHDWRGLPRIGIIPRATYLYSARCKRGGCGAKKQYWSATDKDTEFQARQR